MRKQRFVAMLTVLMMVIATGTMAEMDGNGGSDSSSDTSSVRQSLTASPQGEANGEGFDQPYLVQITEDDPSIGYVVVQLQNTAGLLPLPLEGEYTKTIRQVMQDGSEMVNVVHITPTGFWMEKSNCEGQDCIGEGEVTLENRQERVLGNMVICLPHTLMLYLITREEAEAILCSD